MKNTIYLILFTLFTSITMQGQVCVQLLIPPDPADVIQNPFQENFENYNNGSYQNILRGINRESCPCLEEQNTHIPVNPINTSDIQNQNILVSNGQDQLIAALANIPTNPSNVSLNRTANGIAALRIGNLPSLNNLYNEEENSQFVAYDIDFNSSEIAAIDFDFAAVFETVGVDVLPIDRNPYLKGSIVQIIDANTTNVIDQQCVNQYTSTINTLSSPLALNWTILDKPDPIVQGGQTAGIIDLVNFNAWSTMRLQIPCEFRGQDLQLRIEVGDDAIFSGTTYNSRYSSYAYIDNIVAITQLPICNLIPDFNETIEQCVVDFDGMNNGDNCPGSSFSWRIDGVEVSTMEDFTYTFPESGFYEVCFTIIPPQGCSETFCKTIEVNCCEINSCPDLTLMKNAVGFGDPLIFNPGDTINYQIRVTNNELEGTCPVSFNIRDQLDDDILDLATFTTTHPGVTEIGNIRNFPVTDLEPGTTKSIYFQIEILENAIADEIVNCVSISDPGCETISSCTANAINCNGDNLPINFGSNPGGRINEVAVNNNGYIYLLFDGLDSESSQFDGLVDHDFTNGTYVLKFSPEQCLIDYRELNTTSEGTARMQIDFQNNLYIQLYNSAELIKLDQDLNLVWEIDASTRIGGNINIESPGPGFTSTAKLAYGYDDAGAQLNGNYIVSPFPFTPKGPLVAHLNPNDGSVYDYYLFEAPNQTDSYLFSGSQGIEATTDKLFFSGAFNSSSGGTIDFNGPREIPRGWSSFIARFNIINNQLIPYNFTLVNAGDIVDLEYNKDDNYLYVRDSKKIIVYDENLNLLTPEVFDATSPTDMLYDSTSGTLLVASTAIEDFYYVALYDAQLGNPLWIKVENFDGVEEGIYGPRITRRGDDIYLGGYYTNDVPLSNGLPASVGFDLFLEHFDATNLPAPLTGKAMNSHQDVFRLYPNPTNGSFRIKTLLESDFGSIQLTIRDFSGTIVSSKSMYTLDSPMYLNSLKNGLYFVEIRSGDTIENHKIILKR